MKSLRTLLVVIGVVAALGPVSASGPLGVYGIIEKVVLEPGDRPAERAQLWGAFMYVEGGVGGTAVSAAKRGYLYVKLPSVETGMADARTIETIR